VRSVIHIYETLFWHRPIVQCKSRGDFVGVYKIHFLSQAGEVIGKKVFSAMRNYEAVEIATRLADETRCAGFELWGRHRKIAWQLRNVAEKRKTQSRPSSG
jgi:hypothetical protein